MLTSSYMITSEQILLLMLVLFTYPDSLIFFLTSASLFFFSGYYVTVNSLLALGTICCLLRKKAIPFFLNVIIIFWPLFSIDLHSCFVFNFYQVHKDENIHSEKKSFFIFEFYFQLKITYFFSH